MDTKPRLVDPAWFAKPKPKPKPKKPDPMPGDRPTPVLTAKTDPIYPKRALNNEWEGTIIVEIYVNSLGRASRGVIIKSTGYPILDKSFVRTVKQYYAFEPRRVGGQDLRGTLKLSYTFSLEE